MFFIYNIYLGINNRRKNLSRKDEMPLLGKKIQQAHKPGIFPGLCAVC